MARPRREAFEAIAELLCAVVGIAPGGAAAEPVVRIPYNPAILAETARRAEEAGL